MRVKHCAACAEYQQQNWLEKEGFILLNLEQVEPVWTIAEPIQSLNGKAD